MFESTGWLRSPGHPTGVAISGAAGAADPTAISVTEPTNIIVVSGFRGGRFRFFGDNDAETVSWVIFGIDVDNPAGEITTYMAAELGTAAAVTGDGTLKGVENSKLLNADEFLCQTNPWTATSYGTEVLAYTNGIVLDFDPSSDGLAELLFSDFGNFYGIVVAQEAASGESGGFIYKLDR